MKILNCLIIGLLPCSCLAQSAPNADSKPTSLQSQVKPSDYLSKSLQDLTELAALECIIKAYGLSLDTRDWDLHRSLYKDTYELYRNGGFQKENIETRINRLSNFTDRFAWTQHISSLYSLELDGNKAFVISAMNARHEGKENENGNRSRSYLQTGLYYYWLEKTIDGWRIAKQRNIRSNVIRSLEKEESPAPDIKVDFKKFSQPGKSNGPLAQLIDQVQSLEDRNSIRWTIKAHALSIDTQNWGLYKQLFEDTFETFQNGEFVRESVEDNILKMAEQTNQYNWTQHLASLYSIEIKGTDAFVVSSLNARSSRKVNDEREQILKTGVYHYWLRKSLGVWKIYRLKEINSDSLRGIN